MKKLIEWVKAWNRRRQCNEMMRCIHASDKFTVAAAHKAFAGVRRHAPVEFTPAEKLIADDFGIAYPGDR